MLDIVPSNTHRSGSLINFAAIFACASASPVVVDASSTPKTKNDNQLVITTKNEINTISSNDGKIFDVINTVLKRKAEINIKYDEDLNLYFFVIKTTSELFSSDYDVLDTLDNVLSDYKYMGKSVVATLGE
ncbi:TPA: hypothetical protein NBL27_002859 [Enterococcus faecium]|nr:hypothetical protein [Enterococcus faecium]HBM4451538.1 hypothetical protein [Enterococcus faecium]HCD1731480.1 hypothetical protein [Enterococcus faecium]HCD2636685.1 hypothetical protein [Enterococcus faecium]HCD4033203.1 hypothetical protein [Enterococcus faecium]